ncbi:hypothetical protein [Nitrosomonas communis]|uniref:hypothetical protein n=1 Tax=Nitrosomonas communis TaxID=44574 RepID=UPI0026EDDC80|nr:hypothetical protein [Nitrosomonas communis]MCO6427487.1 hypothetical protein [Nitrosomonas communis]
MRSFSRFLIVLGSALILYGGDTALSIGNTVTHAATVGATSNAEAINTAVTAFQTIGTLRRESPINADAIMNEYSGPLQALAQEVDAKYGLNLDSDILAAIEDSKNNNEPILASQVIDKAIQHIFFQTILDRITVARDDFDNKASDALIQTWSEAIAAFQAIKGTTARENKVLTADRQSIETGSNPALDIQITEAFARGQTALNKENPAEDKIALSIERQVIRLSLARAYYIGVLREVEGIISNRDRDLLEAREKQKEGEIFYRIIESFIKQDNPTGNALIKAQFTGNVSNVVANEIVSELSRGFMGRVNAELKANETSIGTDRGRAMEVAEEAQLYANVFLADLELRLDPNVRANLENALISLKDASNANNASSAEAIRQTISDILANYEKQLDIAKYSKTSDTSFIDSAVSSYQAIGVLRRQSPMSADAIAAEYEGDLQQLTQLVDGVYGLSMNSDIMTAIEFIRSGNQTALAAQAIDKTLQRVFALVVYNRVTLALDTFDNLPTEALGLEWDRAYAAYLAIIGTAGRENKVLTADRLAIESGSNPDLDDHITLAFIHGKEALSKANVNDKTNVAIARENILLPLVRGFLIGVLREVEGIIANRDRDIDEAREKQIEGEFFYRIVEGFISQTNQTGSDRIKAQLTGDLANVVANEIVSEISRGSIGQIRNNLIQMESIFGNDRDQTVLAAERLSLYANIFLPDLALRLGSLERTKLENALQDLKEASTQGEMNKAVSAAQAILSIVANYENALI